MACFLTNLVINQITDKVFELVEPLVYESDLLACTIIVPIGFQSDGASVPRVPIVYMLFGDRAHHEAVIHDWCYRIDTGISFDNANKVFLEAMKVRKKSWFIRWPMFLGVKFGGYSSYHKRKVFDSL